MSRYHDVLESIFTSEQKYTVLQLIKALIDATNELAGKTIVSSSVTQTTPVAGEPVVATLHFTFDDDTTQDLSVTIPAGAIGATGAYVTAADFNNQGHLILTLSNGNTVDAGELDSLPDGVTVHGDISIQGDIEAAYINADNVETDGDVSAHGNVSAVYNLSGLRAKIGTGGINPLSNEQTSIPANVPIIETMSGYSYTPATSQQITINYVGIVKNGNKLTLAVAFTYLRNADGSNKSLGSFTFPAEISALLIPNSLGSVDARGVLLFSAANAYKMLPARLSKSFNTFPLTLYNAYELSDGVTYECRYEATFLLSENLVS